VGYYTSICALFQHNTISKKANGTPSFLQRNVKCQDKKGKTQAYNQYVRPTLEYASSAWDPHTRKNIDKLEQVQRYAARYITIKFSRTASVTKILQDLNWPSLQQRRQQTRLTMYKVSNQLVDTDSFCCFSMAQSNTRGHSARILQPSCNFAVYPNSFFPQTICDWNQLPTNPLRYRTVDSFKSYLNFDLALTSSSSYPDV